MDDPLIGLFREGGGWAMAAAMWWLYKAETDKRDAERSEHRDETKGLLDRVLEALQKSTEAILRLTTTIESGETMRHIEAELRELRHGDSG